METVGYDQWGWNEPKPLSLSLQVRIHITIEYQADVSRRVQDLSHYMRGVIPPHEYAPEASIDFHIHPSNRNPSLYDAVRSLIASTRRYTRVVLLLRAQAEEAGMARLKPFYGPDPFPLPPLLLLQLGQQHQTAPLEEVRFLDLPAVRPHLRHPPFHIRIIDMAMSDNHH